MALSSGKVVQAERGRERSKVLDVHLGCQRVKVFCGRAQEALKTIPDSKDGQDLDKKIQAALKKVKA